MPRFLVEGQWDDDTDTITGHPIDAPTVEEAERLVREVLESDRAYTWTFDRVVSLEDEIKHLQELAAKAEGTFTQEDVMDGCEMSRCTGCQKIFSTYNLEDGQCEDCFAPPENAPGDRDSETRTFGV